MVLALLILALFIGLGILFDIIGVAVTAADPRPFHSMAAHKEKGAKEALKLLRNADRVSSVCDWTPCAPPASAWPGARRRRSSKAAGCS